MIQKIYIISFLILYFLIVFVIPTVRVMILTQNPAFGRALR